MEREITRRKDEPRIQPTEDSLPLQASRDADAVKIVRPPCGLVTLLAHHSILVQDS